MPLSNVNLMGPNPAQPFDIQTQQAQLAQAAEIAKALIAQGMSDGSPIIHTGGGNPFARDVINLDPIGKIAEAYMGYKRLGDIQGQQQGLAQEYNKRVGTSIENFLRESQGGEAPVPGAPQTGGPGGMESGGPAPQQTEYRPGDTIGAVAHAYATGLGPVQEIAKSLMGAQVAMAAKMALTPEAKNGLISAGVDPASIEKATTMGRGPLGIMIPYVDLNKVWMQAKFNEGRTGGIVGSNPSVAPIPGGIIDRQGPVTNVNPQVPGVVPAERSPVPGLPTQTDAAGKVSVVPGAAESPQVKALNEATQASQKEIDEKLPAVLAFQKQSPVLMQVANVIHRANLGKLGEAKQLLTQYATALGLTNDEIGSINSTQTLMALLMPRATALAKDINSTRATQMEFMRATEAVGGGKDVDPRHAMDMVGQALADGMSNVAQFHTEILPRAAKTAIGKEGAAKYVTQMPTLEFPRDMPIKIEAAGPNSFVNKGIETPRAYPGSTPAKKTIKFLGYE